MKRKSALMSIVMCCLLFGACSGVGDATPPEDSDTQVYEGGFEGVDIIIVTSDVDYEQRILTTGLFTLVNELVNPLPTSANSPTDALRIAFTNSAMGLQWDGNAFDPGADGWPGGTAPVGCEDPRGNNGTFFTDYTEATVNLQENTIACDATAIQCPTGWECVNVDDMGVGQCEDANSDGQAQSCPASPESVGQSYLELGASFTNDTLAFTAACMADIGYTQCGFEQQLVAGSAAIGNDGLQTGFIRSDALLLVLLVTDKDDCSIKDGPALFASPEIQDNNQREINTACGQNHETLYTASEIKQQYIDAKAAVSGDSRAAAGVLFAAITGVPMDNTCQGRGDSIGDCLDVELSAGTMGDPGTVTRETSQGAVATWFEYACEREEGSVAVTQAYPGTRIVQLAQEFGAAGYISSFCNEDWGPAMRNIADLVHQQLEGAL